MPEESQLPLIDALKIVYENARQNIESCKNRQWKVAHYTLLSQAALVAVKIHFFRTDSFDSLSCAFVILLVTLTAGGVVLLTRLQSSQQSERQILHEVRKEHFPQRAQDILGIKCRPNFEGFWYHSEVLVLLYAVVVVAAVLGVVIIVWVGAG